MLKVENLYKNFGSLEVLRGINLTIQNGEVAVIIGPSGAGKSTLLRCFNYIETPDKGSIQIGDAKVNSEHCTSRQILNLRRKTAMVFQNYCLFKNKTVLENVMLPMTLVQKMNKKDAHEEALTLINQVGLLDKINEYPSRLSGGQQQRIGIARALAVHPETILFDEPTSSLDPELVDGVLEIIKRLAEYHKCTMILVTHEMRFALEIADKIFFMDDGKILEEGTPEYLLKNAKCEKTKRFLNL